VRQLALGNGLARILLLGLAVRADAHRPKLALRVDRDVTRRGEWGLGWGWGLQTSAGAGRDHDVLGSGGLHAGAGGAA